MEELAAKALSDTRRACGMTRALGGVGSSTRDVDVCILVSLLFSVCIAIAPEEGKMTEKGVVESPIQNTYSFWYIKRNTGNKAVSVSVVSPAFLYSGIAM